MLSMLTLLRGSPEAIDILKSATTLQRAVGAELVVAHPDPVAEVPMTLGVTEGFILPIDYDSVKESTKQAKDAFDSVCRTDTNCRFKETKSPVYDTLRKQTLFADLCVLARDRGLLGEDFSVLKMALVNSHTPTVLLAPAVMDSPPSTIVFSWNGQPPAARAIRAAIPFVKAAKRLVVLEHAGNEINRSRLEHFLYSQGVRPTDWHLYGDNSLTARARARALLDEAKKEGADMLVMGAYGDVGENIFSFGRATDKVASSARIPVLFCS